MKGEPPNEISDQTIPNSCFFVLTLIIGWFPWYTGGGGIIIVALAATILVMVTKGQLGYSNE